MNFYFYLILSYIIVFYYCRCISYKLKISILWNKDLMFGFFCIFLLVWKFTNQSLLQQFTMTFIKLLKHFCDTKIHDWITLFIFFVLNIIFIRSWILNINTIFHFTKLVYWSNNILFDVTRWLSKVVVHIWLLFN